MVRPRVLIGVAVVVGLMSTGSPWAQKASSPTVTAQDMTDIMQLYATLYQGADLREADLWLSTYTDDGMFKIGTIETVGKEALTAWRMQSFGGRTDDSKVRHYLGQVRVVPAPDSSAKIRAYWTVIDVSTRPPTFVSTGLLNDVVVKTPAGWKFKRHHVIGDRPSE